MKGWAMHNRTSFKRVAFSLAVLVMAATAHLCRSAGSVPAPQPSASPLGKLARLSVSGTGYRLQLLRNGARSHSNRKYVWQNVPARLEKLSFTQLAGGKAAKIAIEVREPGTVFFAVRLRSRLTRPLESDGWKQTGMRFNYSDRGKTTLGVLSKELAAGTKMEVPQLCTWTGPIVIFSNLPTADRVAGHEVRLRDGRVFVGVYDKNTGIITLFGSQSGKDAQAKFQLEKEDVEAVTPRVLQIPRLTNAQKAARRKAANAAEKRREAERKRKLRVRAQRALTRVNAKLAQCPRTHDAYLRKSAARDREIRQDMAAVSAQIKKEQVVCDRYRREIALLEATIVTTTRGSIGRYPKNEAHYYGERVSTESRAVTQARADAARVELAKLEGALTGACKHHSKLVKQLNRFRRSVRKARKKYARKVRALTKSKKSLEQRIKKLE